MSDNDNKSDNKNKDDNVVPFAKPKTEPEPKRKPAPKEKNTRKVETKIIMSGIGPGSDSGSGRIAPLINLPPFTKYFIGLILAIHLVITFLLSEDVAAHIYTTYGFVPAFWNSEFPFKLVMLLTPLTHMFLHGSWLHIAMNGMMMMAFGSGVERGIGAKKMIFIFIFSGLCGIALQYALNPASIYPVIGASGGISGLFAAAFVLISRMQKEAGAPPSSLWKFVAVWIGISVIFGFLGSPDGNTVAWMAHLGGFFGGFAALKILKII